MWCIIGNLQEVVTVHVQRGTGLLSLNFVMESHGNILSRISKSYEHLKHLR